MRWNISAYPRKGKIVFREVLGKALICQYLRSKWR